MTEDQQMVVDRQNQNNMVVALPGSGKTYTSIEQAKSILQSSESNRLIMVTFTRAAAGETMHRLSGAVSSSQIARCEVGTFARLMLQQGRGKLLKGRKLVMGNPHQMLIERVAAKYDKKDRDWVTEYLNTQFHLDYLTDESSIEAAGAQYLTILKRYKSVDLGTFSVELIKALRAGEIEPLKFTHIIVDEFQDTDTSQYEWLKANMSDEKCITVVGDDDQSIYGWRAGSNGYESMAKFQENFNAGGILLKMCFRCAPEILRSADALIKHNKTRLPKTMISAKKPGGVVRLKQFTNEDMEEAISYLAEAGRGAPSALESHPCIADYLAGTPNFYEWAVLARTNQLLDNLQFELNSRNVPVTRIGGTSLWDAPPVISFMTILRLLTKVKDSQALGDFLHASNITDNEIHTIETNFSKVGSLSGIETVNLSKKSTEVVEGLKHLSSLYFGNEDDMDFQATLLRKIHIFVLNCLSIGKKNDTTNSNGGGDKGKGEGRTENGKINAVINLFLSRRAPLKKRLQSIEKLSKQKQNYENKFDSVVLATLNGSKGLQWKRVWIMDLEKDRLPNKKSVTYDEEGEITIASLEEERRLLYVGMTRAEEELVLSYRTNKESLFIAEFSSTCAIDDKKTN